MNSIACKAGFVLALLFFTIFTLSCKALTDVLPARGGQDTAEASFFAMDTPMHLRVTGAGADAAADEARDLLLSYDALWSAEREGSDIYRINHALGQEVPIDIETEKLLAESVRIGKETDGALDITLLPVLELWGFSGGGHRVPEAGEIAAAWEKTGLSNLSLRQGDTPAASLKQGGLEVGATAKGYASERVAERLRARGIRSAILDLGGNIEVIGSRLDSTPWRIGIRDPFGVDPVGVVTVEDTSVVTSAIDQRFFTDEAGNRYWHILDPATGHPAQSGLASATIIMRDAGEADALSTAVFVMGKEKATAYWKERQDFDMILVTTEGKVFVTEGIAPSFTPREGEDVETLS